MLFIFLAHGGESRRGETAGGEDHRDGARRGGPVQLQVGRAEVHREGRGGQRLVGGRVVPEKIEPGGGRRGAGRWICGQAGEQAIR